MAELARAIEITGIAHPLVDRVGESRGRRWSLTESRAPVVFLDDWHLDLLRRCVERDRGLVLATDETSALTPAFVHAWREGGAHWLVRDADRGLRDGFTGRALRDVDDLWPASETDPAADGVAVRHLWPQPVDALELSAVVSVRMPARRSSLLGGSVTALAAAVGDVPSAFGSREPALRAWDVEAFTTAVRRRAPEPTRVVVRGRHTAAVVHVRRTPHGVEETTYASLAATGPEADLVAEATERAGDALASIAGGAMPLVGLVLAQRGRSDLLRAPFARPPAVPVALLVGPPVARALGVSAASERQRTGAELVGRPKAPGLLYRLPAHVDDPAAAWRALDDVLSGFDPGTRAAALGAAADALRSARSPSTGSG